MSLQRLLSSFAAQLGHHWQMCSAADFGCGSARSGTVLRGGMAASLLHKVARIHLESARIS